MTIGMKFDGGKNRLDLIQPECIEGLGSVLTFGCEKYEAESWMYVDDAENRYYAALLRHIYKWRKGELVDDESGLSHLDHAMANLMFLGHFTRQREAIYDFARSGTED